MRTERLVVILSQQATMRFCVFLFLVLSGP
jgi:hypothetical protein